MSYPAARLTALPQPTALRATDASALHRPARRSPARAAALTVVLPVAGSALVAAFSPLHLVGAVVVSGLALLLLFLVDGFAEHAFSSTGELVRTLVAAALAGMGIILVGVSVRPDVFSPLLVAGLPVGFAMAGALVARRAVIPACAPARTVPVRTLVLAGDDDPLADEGRRLPASVAVIGRVPLPADKELLAGEITRLRPELVLIEASLAEVDLELLWLCSQRAIRVLALIRPPYGLAVHRPIVRLAGLPWVKLAPFPLAPRHLRGKRALDLGLALLLAPVLVPAMALIVLAIAATSRGGVIYRQRRLGEGGRPFVLLKFRTMHADAERETGPMLAAPADPRVTRIGSVLRRLRLDELPQLWNVVRGEMSLVGPRPERPELASGFYSIPGYEARHLLRPGVTGLAQLIGGYSAAAADKLRSDLLYLSSRSLRLDARLIAATALAFLRGFPDG